MHCPLHGCLHCISPLSPPMILLLPATCSGLNALLRIQAHLLCIVYSCIHPALCKCGRIYVVLLICLLRHRLGRASVVRIFDCQRIPLTNRFIHATGDSCTRTLRYFLSICIFQFLLATHRGYFVFICVV